MKRICLLWMCCISVCAYGAEDLTVSPSNFTLVSKNKQIGFEPDEKVVFKLRLGKNDVQPKDLKVTFSPTKIGSWTVRQSFDKLTLTLSAPKLDAGIKKAQIVITFTGKDETAVAEKSVQATVIVTQNKNSEWESRAIVGYHQAGASSADFAQNFFFDFFTMRGLGSDEHVYDNRYNLWGNVRIASAPQQATTGEMTVSDFAANPQEAAGKLKVNQLAQSAEFQAGLEVKLKLFEQGNRRRMLGFILFGGASGVFTQPALNGEVFKVPDPFDQQAALFQQRYPHVGDAPYVGFVPPDRQRFYRFYGGGLRLTSFELDKPYAPPSTWTLTLGQDESITGGSLRSVVARIDVFYPLPVGKADGRFKFLFLFGTANLRLSQDARGTPLILEKAPEDVPLSDGSVAIETSPSTRDTYRIGVGIDMVNLLRSWKGGN